MSDGGIDELGSRRDLDGLVAVRVEQSCHDLTHRRVIVANEHLGAGVNAAGLVRGAEREGEGERRPLTWCAVGPDAPAVLLDDRPADRQPEAGAGLLAVVGGVDLLEPPEDRLELAGRGAATLVTHADGELVAVRAGDHPDGRAGGRELDGVADQVLQQLAHL